MNMVAISNLTGKPLTPSATKNIANFVQGAKDGTITKEAVVKEFARPFSLRLADAVNVTKKGLNQTA